MGLGDTGQQGGQELAYRRRVYCKNTPKQVFWYSAGAIRQMGCIGTRQSGGRILKLLPLRFQ